MLLSPLDKERMQEEGQLNDGRVWGGGNRRVCRRLNGPCVHTFGRGGGGCKRKEGYVVCGGGGLGFDQTESEPAPAPLSPLSRPLRLPAACWASSAALS
eukprot:366356-Chlamydomonas_euryale.AAC.6